jgi:hypothetical protein
LTGATGARGKRGVNGVRGERGLQGAIGPQGPAGAGEPAVSLDVHALAVVHDQIEHIHHELDVQLKRMAQLQAEVDEVRSVVKRLLAT